MMKQHKKKSRPPRHLQPATRHWWADVVETYELQPHHLLLLTAAGESFDRATLAREAVDADGAFFVDRHGSRKPHPGLQVERDSRALFSRLLRELALDVEAPDARRPPLGKGY
jgi:phage terminase small subunit